MKICSKGQLAQEEIDNIRWFEKQYRLIIPSNDSLLCGLINQQYLDTACSNVIAGYQYFTRITIKQTSTNNLGNPDPNRVLNFPILQELRIQLNNPTDLPTNQSINLLERFGNLRSLNYLELQNEQNISSIPETFPIGSNVIEYVYFRKIRSITSIPNRIFSLALKSFECDLCSISSIPQIQYGVNFTTLKIGFAGSNLNFSFERKYYPNLFTLVLAPSGFNNTVNLEGSAVSQINIIDSTEMASVNVKLGNIYNLTLLTISQNNLAIRYIDFEDLSLYKKLTKYTFLYFRNSQYQVEYPTKKLPPNLLDFGISNSDLKQFPNITIPSSVTNFDFVGNTKIEIPFPDDFGYNLLATVNLVSYPLRKAVGDGACSWRSLNIVSAQIKEIPDCYNCFYKMNNFNNNYFVHSNEFTYNTSFVCPGTTISTTTYVSLDGFITLRGKNFGWGIDNTDPNLQVILPNHEFRYKVSNFSALSSNIVISDYLKSNYTVNYFDGRFNLNNVSMDQYPNNKILVTLNTTVNDPTLSLLAKVNNNTGNPIQCSDFTVIENGIKYTCMVDNKNNQIRTLSNNTVTLANDYIFKDLKAFYEQYYPIVNSIDEITTKGGIVTVYGEFGPFLNSTLIRVNSIDTEIINSTRSRIIFKAPANLKVGLADFSLLVDNYPYQSSTIFNVVSQKVEEDCIKKFNNCSGNGYCDPFSGVCICTKEGVTGDRCSSPINPDIIFKPNETDPTAIFQSNDTSFSFSIKEIQEIDSDGNMVNLMKTNNWIFSVTNISGAQNYSYVLNHTVALLDVSASIIYTEKSRTYRFGDKEFQQPANTIKVSVGINGWQYSNTLTHLRVIFETFVNNKQYTGCDQTEVPTYEMDNNGESIQLIRVIKDKVQFFGRFLNYALSNGRPTYVKNSLVNQTQINEDVSLALIAVSFPQCEECLLDPDFSPLLNVDDGDSCKKESKAWKIAVGVVVGFVCLAAIVVGIVLYSIKMKKMKQFNMKVQMKLNNFKEKETEKNN